MILSFIVIQIVIAPVIISILQDLKTGYQCAMFALINPAEKSRDPDIILNFLAQFLMPLVLFNLVILISGADCNPFDPTLLLYFVDKAKQCFFLSRLYN